MEFTVRLFKDTPDYETLPTAKIVHYPREKKSYKPYAQGRVCASPEGLHLHMLSFEAVSLPTSSLCAVVRINEKGLTIVGRIYADGSAAVEVDGKEISALNHRHLAGEDMQGVFWGGILTLPMDQDFSLQGGMTLWGNFYKICQDERRPHYGSFAPANFELPIQAQENLIPWRCITF